VTWLKIGCDPPERRATRDDSPSLAKVTCTDLLTIGQESFSVSGLRYVHGMGAWHNAELIDIGLHIECAVAWQAF